MRLTLQPWSSIAAEGRKAELAGIQTYVVAEMHVEAKIRDLSSMQNAESEVLSYQEKRAAYLAVCP